MNAYDLCQRHVVTVRRHEELATAAWMMRERHVGCLVVVDPMGSHGGWRPVGLLCDRDIVTNVFARECDPRSVLVDEVMQRHPMTALGNTGVEEILQRMRAARVRRVPVVDERGCLVGLLNRDDVFEHALECAHGAVVPLGAEAHIDKPVRPAALQAGSVGMERI